MGIKIALSNVKTSHLKAPIFKAGIFILVLYFYYLAIQKFVAFNSYKFWIEHAPIVKQYSNVFVYTIPSIQLGLSALLLILKTRVIALFAIILQQLIFVIWVGYVFYATPYIFWPWIAIRNNWLYKLIEVLTIAWVALISLKSSINTTQEN